MFYRRQKKGILAFNMDIQLSYANKNLDMNQIKDCSVTVQLKAEKLTDVCFNERKKGTLE